MQPYEILERDLARWADVPIGTVAVCASGTAALHLALECLRLPPGTEVVTNDYSMIAVPRAIALAGLQPALADCGPADLNLHPEAVREAIWRETAAILAVHVYGRRANMDALHAVAHARGLPVAEDMAELHGVSPHPESAAACWSFFANKIVGGAEGGAVYFRDPALAALARQLRCLGFTDAHDYRHVPRGHNYRLSNAHASLIQYGLACFEANWEARRDIETWYDGCCPREWRLSVSLSPWVYAVRLPGLTRERMTRVVAALNAAGIAARHGFWPISRQDEFAGCDVAGWGHAARAADEVFCLPIQPGCTTPDACRAAIDLIRRHV